MDISHIGKVIFFENAVKNIILFTVIGALIGFFIYYLGLIVIAFVFIGFIIGILQFIFAPKINCKINLKKTMV